MIILSGGHFEYKQYKCGYLADDVLDVIREFSDRASEDNYDISEYDKNCFIKTCKISYDLLKLIEMLVQRIDWYLSGDDGMDNFIKKLKNELQDSYKCDNPEILDIVIKYIFEETDVK